MDDPGPSTAYYHRFASRADGPVRPPAASSPPLLGETTDPQAFLDAHARDGLYAVLNVERSATAAEIRDQYRSLASVYHPDKQPDEAHRRAAHARFTALQRAYEVLTDDAQRTVYDLFGEEGLRTKWEVGPRNLTKAQMRAHFLGEDEIRQRMEAAALVNSKGNMSITLDARGVFLPESRFDNPEEYDHSVVARLQRTQVGQVLLKHSFETPISERTQFVMEGQMAAMRGAGGANLSGTIKHQFSPRLWMQATQTILAPHITSVKGTYTFDEFTYVTGTAIQQTWLAPPRLSVTLGRKLYEETTGFVTFKSGFFTLGPWGRRLPLRMLQSDQSALSVGMTTARKNGSGWTVELQTGVQANGLSGDWSAPLAGLTLKLGAYIDIMGSLSVFADASGRVTEHTSAGAQLAMGMSGALTLKLFVARLGQRLTLPVLMTPDLNPSVIFFSTVLPAAGYAAAYRYWLLPRKHARIRDRVHELQREHKEYTAQKRAEAEEAQLAMERVAESRRDTERRRNGLVILDAKYGRADAFTPRGYREANDDEGFPVIVDVTTSVQMLVVDSRLYVPAGRAKHGLNGFYDPCIGENKRLRVRYLFRGKTHEVTVDDIGSLLAPVQAHALDE